ncbi:putative cysteine-rich repeat secretory protein 37 [Capsella rubella]|uniref:putative cysteine-rich repeat secretory protein 37 n=1 Tax=Capsella rubella TaxID=81985 RepID=UPI000CD4C33C|nr:putative cysteine-rich repeat secretory protein 37 [Capsella rubella]
MYFSYSLSKRLVSIPILAIQLLLISSVSCLNLTNDYLNHKCLVSEGKYRTGDEYEENLNFLIRQVLTYSYPSGFIHISHGDVPNLITIVLQCRGDSYDSKCLSCFNTALSGLRKRCQRNKGGIVWYDQCFLYITSAKLPPGPRKNDYKNIFSMHNPKNVIEGTESFNKKTRDFLYELMVEATRPNRPNKNMFFYAAGEKRLGEKKLYAMVQCAQDILHCKGCLEWSIKELPKCCDAKQGARVLGTECSLRYELYPFLRS